MTDRPIIFSAPMVRAILDGRKTQTRRVMTPRNTWFDGGAWPRFLPDFHWDRAWVDPGPSPAGNPGPYLNLPRTFDDDETVHRIYPRSAAGDRLYVREAFSPFDCGDPCSIERASYVVLRDGTQCHKGREIVPALPRYADGAFDGIRWRPSSHMPRWASRLTLVVTDVRVERLQDTSLVDAIAEGCDGTPGHDTICDFSELWDRLHGPGSWDANPLVVALTFTTHLINIDHMPTGAGR